MLSELQIRNIGAIFDVLDHDKDGMIEREDFYSLGDDISNGIGLPDDSAHRKSLMEGYDAWYGQIRVLADVDRDGKVSKDEFVRAAEQGLLAEPAYFRAVRAAADAVFEAADRDSDGELSEAEMVGVYVAFGYPAEIARTGFQHIDADGDGRISEAEFREACVGTFTSVTPEDVGAHMLGNA